MRGPYPFDPVAPLPIEGALLTISEADLIAAQVNVSPPPARESSACLRVPWCVLQVGHPGGCTAEFGGES